MGWLISTVLSIIVCGIAVFVGRGLRNGAIDPDGIVRDRSARSTGNWLFWGGILVFVFWFGIFTIVKSVKTVSAGHVGIVYEFGAIDGQIPEGFQIVAPWKSVKEQSIQVQRYSFEQGVLDSFSEETQDVFVIASLNYQVDPQAIEELYTNVGPNWFERLVIARAQQTVKDETVKYRTVDIAPNREQIRIAVRDRLKAQLAPYSISVVDFLVENINFRDEFKTSIEQKQIATQDALREQERVRQAEFEAQQAIEKARGEAESTRIRAEGQAEANQLLTASLTPELIQWQAVQKLSDNIELALIPSGEGIIIDPATILNQTANAEEEPQP